MLNFVDHFGTMRYNNIFILNYELILPSNLDLSCEVALNLAYLLVCVGLVHEHRYQIKNTWV